MVQLRNGHGYSMGMTQQQELAVMQELYPDLDPGLHRMTATKLTEMIDVAMCNTSCTVEERLHGLHHMLELCTIEHEFEVQDYQAAHRRLLEHEGKFNDMLLVPDVPSCALHSWESYINQRMNAERVIMKESRKKTKAVLRTIRYAEEQVRKAEKVVAAKGKADRLLRESNQVREQQMARLAANAEVAEQIHSDPRTRSLKGKNSAQDRS
ncbi:MAG: hypothetical protein Q9209_000681 [Squamulea sp. 1 TL-2023]